MNTPQQWGVVTAKDKKLYLHVLEKPGGAYIFVPGITQKITKASPMNKEALKLKFKQQPEGVFLYLADLPNDEVDTIIQLDVQ